MNKRLFSSLRRLQGHDNPLGLPMAKPKAPRRGLLPEKRQIVGVHKVVAVSSCKGGVGKSTVAANLALSFARKGWRSGILDVDIFGPSIPTLFNLADAEEPILTERNQLTPLTNYGVKTMSMGYLVKPESPIVWRGLMVMKAIQQLLHEVDWGGLDVLVIDLPPGTGDTPLSVAQQVELAGTVVVSTPQDLALSDTRRGVEMFRRVGVAVLGMVQNMSMYTCPHCGETSHLFGRDGVRDECSKMGVELLGDIPLDSKICEAADKGKPTVVGEPESDRAKVYMGVADRLETMLNMHGIGFPAYKTEVS